MKLRVEHNVMSKLGITVNLVQVKLSQGAQSHGGDVLVQVLYWSSLPAKGGGKRS